MRYRKRIATITIAWYSTSTASPAHAPAATSRRPPRRSRKAARQSAPAATCPKTVAASGSAMVPTPKVAAVSPPVPGRSPSATRPTRNVARRKKRPPVSSRKIQSERGTYQTPFACFGGTTTLAARKTANGTTARNEIPGALSVYACPP
jgi:hypothetical protein